MKQEKFSSGWGFVLAAAGSAIGLGNVWRFPYLVGEYGGLTFILVYLFVVLVICKPLMVAEIALGRTAKSNFVDAYSVIGNKIHASRLGVWKFCGGWVAALSLWMIISFYFVVAGWVLYYLCEALSGELLQDDVQILEEEFNHLSKTFTVQFAAGMGFLLMTCMIVVGGVKKGIEKVSMFLMPVLFLLLCVMALQSFIWDSSHDGFGFLLTPQWEYLGFEEDGFNLSKFAEIFMAAFGQAFISLSLGYGVLLVYGSYLPDKENLFKTVQKIEIFDTLAALLSAFAVIPAIFAAGLVASAGPKLTFISLPIVFSQMPFGNVGASLFYFLLVLATITSTISVIEALVNLVMSKFKVERFTAVMITLLVSGMGFLLVTLSFSETAPWLKVAGKDLFTFFDWIASTYMTAIVSLTMALFVGYKCMKQLIKNIAKSADVSEKFIRYFLVMLRYVAPIFLILMLGLALFHEF